jgi:hypothetical protein
MKLTALLVTFGEEVGPLPLNGAFKMGSLLTTIRFVNRSFTLALVGLRLLVAKRASIRLADSRTVA